MSQGQKTPRPAQRLPGSLLRRSTVFWAQTYSLSSFATGPVNAILVVATLSPTSQGIYYTFGALLSVLTLLDFGSCQTLAQLTGRAHGRPQIHTIRPVVPNDEGTMPLAAAATVAWNRVTTALFVLAVGVGGTFLLSNGGVERGQVLPQWGALVLVSVAHSLLAPHFAVLQGRHPFVRYWFFRFALHWVYALTLWSALLLDADLWAPATASMAALCWSMLFLRENRQDVSLRVRRMPPRKIIDVFRGQIWPLQWRLGLSWFSAVFTITWLTFLAMAYHGPIPAAQVGLTVSLALVVFTFGTNWLTPDEPRFASAVAGGGLEELRREFPVRFWSSLLLTGSIVILASAGIIILSSVVPSFAQRILPPSHALILLLGTMGVVAIRNLSSYCRAHCADPCAVPLAVGSGAGLLIAAAIGKQGTGAIAVGYAVGVIGLALPWCSVSFRRLWMATTPVRA